MNPFARKESQFDDPDEFVPEHLPEPGDALDAHRLLTGDDHVAVHTPVRAAFEACGVSDSTFGYNLARLNEDRRHPDAGFRYAEDGDDPRTLRVTFTPTTEFCPQAEVLAVGAFRALVRERDRLPYDRVRVRIDGHHGERSVNERLADLKARVEERGSLPDPNRFG